MKLFKDIVKHPLMAGLVLPVLVALVIFLSGWVVGTNADVKVHAAKIEQLEKNIGDNSKTNDKMHGSDALRLGEVIKRLDDIKADIQDIKVDIRQIRGGVATKDEK